MTRPGDAMRSARPLLALVLLALAATGCRADRSTVDADQDGVVATVDCDDSNAAVHANVMAYADTDGDGVGAGPGATFCTDGMAPTGYSLAGTDCAPGDTTTWRAITNPPTDRDGDGFTVPDPVTICVGTALPAPYLAESHGNDCDDGRTDLYRWVVLYRDRDGDRVGVRPRSIVCAGASLPAGYATAGFDPDDSSSTLTSSPDEDLAWLLD